MDTVTNSSGDFDGLANALGETAPHEVIPVVSAPQEVTPVVGAPQQFNIATPRDKSKGNKNTIRGALAAIAAEKQTARENVDAGIAPVARRRATKHTIRGALASLAVGKLSAPDAGN